MVVRIMGWVACACAPVLLVVAMIMGTAPAAAAARAAHVTNAWIRLAAVPGRPAAGYFRLVSDHPVDLVGVTAPHLRAELHGMSTAGGVMRMDRLRAAHADRGHDAVFAPGGAHLMLFDVPAGVRPGATLPLTFTFGDGTVVHADAAVRAAGADAPMAGMKM